MIIPVNAEDIFKKLLNAIANSDVNVLQRFDRQNPHFFETAGGPFLGAAVEVGDPNVVLFLIQAGADVNWRDKEGKTPLHIAVEWCDSKIIEDLCFNGAKINATDNEGHTPYYTLTAINSVFKMRNMSVAAKERHGVKRRITLKECQLSEKILRNNGGKMFIK